MDDNVINLYDEYEVDVRRVADNICLDEGISQAIIITCSDDNFLRVYTTADDECTVDILEDSIGVVLTDED